MQHSKRVRDGSINEAVAFCYRIKGYGNPGIQAGSAPDAGAFGKSRGSYLLEKSTVMPQINGSFFKSKCSYRTLYNNFLSLRHLKPFSITSVWLDLPIPDFSEPEKFTLLWQGTGALQHNINSNVLPWLKKTLHTHPQIWSHPRDLFVKR